MRGVRGVREVREVREVRGEPFPCFDVNNPQNPNCGVCTGFNSIYGPGASQKEMKMPEEMGTGYCRRLIIKPSMGVSIADLTFNQDLIMDWKANTDQYTLAFCLGEQLEYSIDGNQESLGKEFVISGGESCIFNWKETTGICAYTQGQRFLGLTIHVDWETIRELIPCLEENVLIKGPLANRGISHQKKFSATIRRIALEIVNCQYCDCVKRVYLEGKILELLAVYMDETILEKGVSQSSISLSLADLEALHRAKKILDNNIANPPPLTELAKQVFLNSYKLKVGFKELFGTTVHGYVINNRLEMSRVLLDEKKLRVMDAALLVGYSDASHFAEKFREKYGINPSAYAKT